MSGNQVREPSQGTKSSSSGSEQRQLSVRGKSGDPVRGTWCTPKWLADAVGEFALDPFANPRSHVRSVARCALEDGGDGFGDGSPGSYRCGAAGEIQHATSEDTVWIQPPYDIVLRAFDHYAHTRWVALLRFDPRPEWFDAIYDAAELVAVIRHDPEGRPFGFEPPPGVVASTNTFPHALYARHAEDIPRAALRYCAAWRKRPT
jgi:hypothetical protein